MIRDSMEVWADERDRLRSSRMEAVMVWLVAPVVAWGSALGLIWAFWSAWMRAFFPGGVQ